MVLIVRKPSQRISFLGVDCLDSLRIPDTADSVIELVPPVSHMTYLVALRHDKKIALQRTHCDRCSRNKCQHFRTYEKVNPIKAFKRKIVN